MEEVQEYPKMLYKHSEDAAKEDTFVIVNTEDEQTQALANGYDEKQHVPKTEGDNGVPLTPPTANPEVVPHEEDSPKDILEDQHMNDKPDGEKVAE